MLRGVTSHSGDATHRGRLLRMRAAAYCSILHYAAGTEQASCQDHYSSGIFSSDIFSSDIFSSADFRPAVFRLAFFRLAIYRLAYFRLTIFRLGIFFV